jgi:hypothetical protein
MHFISVQNGDIIIYRGEIMEITWEKISSYITSENIALLSVIITVLIFIITRHAEIRYKKHDDKKVQYLKLIALIQKSLSNSPKNGERESILDDETRKQFFDTGASLLLYGSKKIYRRYLLFREFATNPLIKKCKYYKDDMAMFIIADILRIMRKEVGLSYFNSIRNNEALAFFVNDISSGPIAKEKAMDAMFRIKMVRFELAMIDRYRFIFIKRVYMTYIKPFYAGISIIWKYVVKIPLGRLIIKIFPESAQKNQESKNTRK